MLRVQCFAFIYVVCYNCWIVSMHLLALCVDGIVWFWVKIKQSHRFCEYRLNFWVCVYWDEVSGNLFSLSFLLTKPPQRSPGEIVQIVEQPSATRKCSTLVHQSVVRHEKFKLCTSNQLYSKHLKWKETGLTSWDWQVEIKHSLTNQTSSVLKPHPNGSCTFPSRDFLEWGGYISPDLNIDPGSCSGKAQSPCTDS